MLTGTFARTNHHASKTQKRNVQSHIQQYTGGIPKRSPMRDPKIIQHVVPVEKPWSTDNTQVQQHPRNPHHKEDIDPQWSPQVVLTNDATRKCNQDFMTNQILWLSYGLQIMFHVRLLQTASHKSHVTRKLHATVCSTKASTQKKTLKTTIDNSTHRIRMYAILMVCHLPSTKTLVLLASIYHTYGSVMGNGIYKPTNISWGGPSFQRG